MSFSEFVSVALVSDSDVSTAVTILRPSKSVGVDAIPGFIIKGCTDIFRYVLKHIFNISFSPEYFPSLWKQAAIVPILKQTTVPTLAVKDLYPFSLMFPHYLNLLFLTMFALSKVQK